MYNSYKNFVEKIWGNESNVSRGCGHNASMLWIISFILILGLHVLHIYRLLYTDY